MPLKLEAPVKGRTPNWRIRGTHGGVRIDESARTGDRRVAQKLLERIKAGIDSGRVSAAPRLTFAGAAISYLQAGHGGQYLDKIIRRLGETAAADIDQATLDAAAVALYPRASPATRNRQVYTPVLAVLRHSHICPPVNRPKGSQGTPRDVFLTYEHASRVLTAAGRRHLAAASMHVSPDVPSTGVDVSLLEYISDGTGQGLSRQIELFLTALGEAEKQLDEAARTSNFTLLGEAAHGVLSHARLVGSASLSTAAAGLQNAANMRDRDAFGSLLQRVRREIESLTAVVRRHPGAERPA